MINIDINSVQRPQRYVGNEWNACRKSHDGRISVCLCFPDLYEVGMSNLGLRIIYGQLNQFADVVCERVFLPGDDFAAGLTANHKKLASLETQTPLSDFQVLGFNLSYELNYTNILKILDLGGIELLAKDRKDIIVLAGGGANPEPLADFVDVFFIGEFEAAAEDFINVLRRTKDKEERLLALSGLAGFYVPKLNPNANLPIKKAYVRDLDKAYYPDKWLVPYSKIVHDRIQVEIARGCPNKCNFCQACTTYYPYRQRSRERVAQIIRQLYESSGYEEVSLLSLSASDHSQIGGIIEDSLDYFKDKKVALALPSLRVDDIIGGLYEKLIPLNMTSLTVAVEAAQDPLRESLNKKIDTKRLFEAAKMLKSMHLKHIKLYFMYGLPNETEEDLIAIGNFLKKLYQESRINLNVSLNVFVPKPFSSFETAAMDSRETLLKKKDLILRNIPRQVKLATSYIPRSIMEAIISRAGRDFAKVIKRVYHTGGYYSEGPEGFNWQIWETAMKEEGFDWHSCLEGKTSNYPWSFIQWK